MKIREPEVSPLSHLLLRSRLFRQLATGAILLHTLAAQSATFRWASSSNRIYVEGGGNPATLSDIKAALPNAPLDLIDPLNKIWLLSANLQITDGSALVLHGTGIGGDVNELRLKSDNSASATRIISVTADWGAIDIQRTKVTSWDSVANGPDTEYETYGRSSIRVRSRLSANGVTPLESRMDILDSDVGYLGHDASESYGLSWKVVGNEPGLYDRVKVRGDIINSRIHHNLFGVYTYGAQGCRWLDNEVDNNAGYGFDPHDDSDGLLIEGNNVHHNGHGNLQNSDGGERGLHGIIASKGCDHLVIRGNYSWANAGNGIMLHRHCDDSLVEDNVCEQNGDSGIALFDTDRATIRNNLLSWNGKHGIRASVGCSDNLIKDNEISSSGEIGIYLFPGSDAAEPDEVDPTVTNRNRRNQFLDNYVYYCAAEGIKLSDGDENQFIGNIFFGNGPLLRFTGSTETLFINNWITTDVTLKLNGSPSSPNFVYFSGQPFVKLEMDQYSDGSYFEDENNAIFDVEENIFSAASGVPPNASSTLTLVSSQIGGATTVVTRNLFAYVETGTVWVNPTLWEFTGARSKAWRASAASGGPVRYVVGDLTPGVRYRIRQDSASVGLFAADNAGRVSFRATPGTAAELSYTVFPE